MTDAREVVIWSADVDEPTLDGMVADELPVRYIKLDRYGLAVMGHAKIAELQDRGYLVFADEKIDEIPDKALLIASLSLPHKPWMLNCMAEICSTNIWTHENKKKIDGLKRFADACHTAGTKPCGVTVKTSKTPEVVALEHNGRTPIEQVLVYVEMLLQAGFTDLVCSPEEVPAIRAESRFKWLEINTPGIRLPDSDTRDQARVNTPAAAIAARATRVVIGSDLTNGDFRENFERIAANLNGQ